MLRQFDDGQLIIEEQRGCTMTTGSDVEKVKIADQGERAFEEGIALIDVLKEACEGRSTITLEGVATVLGVTRERMVSARSAFTQLAAPE